MMKKLFPIIIFVVFLAACAAPAPTAAPTAAVPQPTTAPVSQATTTRSAPSPLAPQTRPPAQPTNSPITIIDLSQTKQPDGSIKTTAQVTAQENLGLGQMEIASPGTMLMGETRTIRLRVSPSQQIASATSVPAPGKTPDLPAFVYKFGGNIDLYPIMFAELRTLSFDVDKQGPIRRDVTPNTPAIWDWIVSPRSPGRQELAIEISIPAVINGVDSQLSTLQDVPIAIEVQSPVPTPVPLSERIGESLVANSGAIIVALIGLVGTLVGILMKMRSDQDKDAKKRKK
jgi:hypothetical protein